MIAFIESHLAWCVPILLVMSFLKSLAILSLVVPETLMVAIIGVATGVGQVSPWPIWLVIGTGAGLGDWASYALGYRLKDRARHIWPFRSRPELIARGERLFRRWGAMSVVLCRFFSPLRATVPLLCGVFEMRQPTFQLANWVSAFLWSGVVLAVGMGLGRLFG